eukprot:Rhum_TRINITY_DN13123_c0_g1::Rhum_TRINITY_DN13123_c0_g1_i1::g.57249::m.57249
MWSPQSSAVGGPSQSPASHRRLGTPAPPPATRHASPPAPGGTDADADAAAASCSPSPGGGNGLRLSGHQHHRPSSLSPTPPPPPPTSSDSPPPPFTHPYLAASSLGAAVSPRPPSSLAPSTDDAPAAGGGRHASPPSLARTPLRARSALRERSGRAGAGSAVWRGVVPSSATAPAAAAAAATAAAGSPVEGVLIKGRTVSDAPVSDAAAVPEEAWTSVLAVAPARAAAWRVDGGGAAAWVGLATETVCCYAPPRLAAVPSPAAAQKKPLRRACASRELQWGVAVSAATGEVRLLSSPRVPLAVVSGGGFGAAEKVTVAASAEDRSFSVRRDGRLAYVSPPGLCPEVAEAALYPFASILQGGGAYVTLVEG